MPPSANTSLTETYCTSATLPNWLIACYGLSPTSRLPHSGCGLTKL